jgi:CRP-like cAMP-binding protein
LSDACLEELASTARMSRWRRNQVALQQGEPGDALVMVVSGRVKLRTVAPGGRERIVGLVEAGGVFGELALLDGEPRSATAVALEPTLAVILRRRAVQNVLRSDASFAERMIVHLCARVRRTTMLIEESIYPDPTTRLARRLRDLVHQMGRGDQEGWVLEGLSQQDLADAVGLARESVNKLLRAWRSDGIVAVERRTVVVRDLSRIQQMARLDA